MSRRSRDRAGCDKGATEYSWPGTREFENARALVVTVQRDAVQLEDPLGEVCAHDLVARLKCEPLQSAK